MRSVGSSSRRWHSRASNRRTDAGCRKGAQQHDLLDVGEELVTHFHGRTGQRMGLPSEDARAMWWIGSRSP